MARDNEHNPDPNANAARIVAESTAAGELPHDLEAAGRGAHLFLAINEAREIQRHQVETALPR